MKSLQVIFASAVFALFVSQASAQQTPYFKAPIDVNGTGCPIPDSITVTGANSPNLTVMFSKYDAAKPRDRAASKMDNSSCNFAVPIHVPTGYQVSLLTTDWMGYAEGKTELFRRYSFVGGSLSSQIPKTSNPTGNFSLRDSKLYGTTSFTPCGKDAVLRINSRVRAISTPSYIAVDTVDLNTKVVFMLQWQKCQ